jgi:hypothetical protein
VQKYIENDHNDRRNCNARKVKKDAYYFLSILD